MSSFSSDICQEDSLWEELLYQEISMIQELRKQEESINQLQDRQTRNYQEIKLLKVPSAKLMEFKQIQDASLQLQSSLFSQENQNKVGFKKLDGENITISFQNNQLRYENNFQHFQFPKKSETVEKIIENKHILKQKNLRKNWKKNTNIPKFIARIFIKYFPSYVPTKQRQNLIKYHYNITKELNHKNSIHYSIPDVATLLGNYFDNDFEGYINRMNRKILFQIINNTLKTEVIQNKYIKENQKSYLIAMKVYSLRCRSKTLTQRVQIF